RAFLGDELITVDSPSKIYDRRRFIDFPPTPLNALFSGLGPVEAFRVAADFVRSRSRGRDLVSFEDFAISQFGETLARRILLNYSEKLWGLPASELSPDVATRRLSGMSLASLFLELFLPRRKTAHIDGAFLYPKHGYGKIVEALEAAVPADSLCREHELASIRCERGRIVEIEFTGRGTAEIFGRVVSTLPSDPDLLSKALPAERLQQCVDLSSRSALRHLAPLRTAKPVGADGARGRNLAGGRSALLRGGRDLHAGNQPTRAARDRRTGRGGTYQSGARY